VLLEPILNVEIVCPSDATAKANAIVSGRRGQLLGFDNREGIFPIHRGVRFVLLAATAYEPSNRIGARFGLHTAITLDDIPDEGSIPGGTVLPRTLIERWSGASLAIPELTAPRDREVLARVVDTIPPLGDAAGWNAHFGRELNATDDRGAFGSSGLPVLEGKLIEPFEVHVDRAAAHIDARAAARILGSRAAFTRPRLGYREVAASTNRLTLIAAMIPAGTVTTHSVFVLKTPLDDAAQWFLCGIFNSFVANYLVRLRGGTHVTAAAMELLRVPRPVRDDVFLDVAALARALTRDPRDTGSYVTLQVRVAALYGLAADEFAHVLGTFPLIDPSLRARCRAAYEML
jgi:hypothetical protein